MASSPRITIYLDTVSPFAYIAYRVLRNDAAFKKCQITYVPIFLGGLMKMCGNQPPINITNKDKWIDKERQRWAALFNVPMNQQMPPNFPPRTLNIMRALAALDEVDGGNQERLMRALDGLWHEFFVKHTATHEPAELRRILASVLGSEAEADKILQAASSEAEDGGKKAVTRNTDMAFKEGAFGLPWMVCTRADGQKEAFWGVDHMGQAAAFLGLERPGTGGWKALL